MKDQPKARQALLNWEKRQHEKPPRKIYGNLARCNGCDALIYRRKIGWNCSEFNSDGSPHRCKP